MALARQSTEPGSSWEDLPKQEGSEAGPSSVLGPSASPHAFATSCDGSSISRGAPQAAETAAALARSAVKPEAPAASPPAKPLKPAEEKPKVRRLLVWTHGFVLFESVDTVAFWGCAVSMLYVSPHSSTFP